MNRIVHMACNFNYLFEKIELLKVTYTVTWPIFNVSVHNGTPGTTEVTVVKFCVQVEYIKW